MTNIKLLVIVPTRNRADFAITAVKSVLSQKDCDFDLLVSDNSTENEQLRELANFCEQTNDARLRYVRPPQPLPMTEHWDWAMTQGLESSSASHILCLTDRSFMKPDALSDLTKIAENFQDKPIAYPADTINDFAQPIYLAQPAFTGKLLELNSSYLFWLAAQSRLMTQMLPKLLNSCVPRELVMKVKDKYGKFFDSVSPDFCFAYSCLTITEKTLFYDKALFISYGLYRSNGASFVNGIASKDTLDFRKNMTVKNWVIPGSQFSHLNLLTNATLHEYFYVKNKSDKKLFPDLDYNLYLRAIMKDITGLENTQLRGELLREFYAVLKLKAIYLHSKIWFDKKRAQIPIRTILKSYWHNARARQAKHENQATQTFATTDDAIKYIVENPKEPSSESSNILYLTKESGENAAKMFDQNVKHLILPNVD